MSHILEADCRKVAWHVPSPRVTTIVLLVIGIGRAAENTPNNVGGKRRGLASKAEDPSRLLAKQHDEGFMGSICNGRDRAQTMARTRTNSTTSVHLVLVPSVVTERSFECHCRSYLCGK